MIPQLFIYFNKFIFGVYLLLHCYYSIFGIRERRIIKYPTAFKFNLTNPLKTNSQNFLNLFNLFEADY